MKYLQQIFAHFTHPVASQRGVGCVMGSHNFQTIYNNMHEPHQTAEQLARLTGIEQQLKLALALVASQNEIITLLRRQRQAA